MYIVFFCEIYCVDYADDLDHIQDRSLFLSLGYVVLIMQMTLITYKIVHCFSL